MHKRCFFAGHSTLYEDVHEKLKSAIEHQILHNGVDEFWVGNYGAFDSCVAIVIKDLKKIYDVELNMVIPYLTKEINDNREWYQKKYDHIIIAENQGAKAGKYSILKCNQYMVDNSGFLICYVKYSWGGAAKTVEYAKRKNHIKIYNLIGI